MDAPNIRLKGDFMANTGLSKAYPTTAAPLVKGVKDLEGMMSVLP